MSDVEVVPEPSPTQEHQWLGYHGAKAAIADGGAIGRALWVLLSNEHDRDGYALKPMPWEGPGEYQHVTFRDGRDGFVRIAPEARSLPCAPYSEVAAFLGTGRLGHTNGAAQ